MCNGTADVNVCNEQDTQRRLQEQVRMLAQENAALRLEIAGQRGRERENARKQVCTLCFIDAVTVEQLQ